MNINGTYSKISELACGVPQGSCVGPVLFTQYASSLYDVLFTQYSSSLYDVIYQHLDNGHWYADDYQLYLPFSPDSLLSQKEAITLMEN